MIKTRNQVNLTSQEQLLIEKGWGSKVLNDVSIEKISYTSDNFLVEGYIAKPKETNNKLPLIIWNRGGDKNNGRLDDFLAWGILGEIASWGYIVIASQYRDDDEFGGEEINDIINLFEIAKTFKEFDGINIGVEGWSRGGMMTYLLLKENIKINFKCALIVAGLADIKRNIEINKRLKLKVLKNYDTNDFDSEIGKRSAVNFYKSIKKIPILLLHGTADNKVKHYDSIDMYNYLKESGNENVELKLFERGDHFLRKERNEVSTIRKNWYDKYLKFNKS